MATTSDHRLSPGLIAEKLQGLSQAQVGWLAIFEPSGMQNVQQSPADHVEGGRSLLQVAPDLLANPGKEVAEKRKAKDSLVFRVMNKRTVPGSLQSLELPDTRLGDFLRDSFSR